MVRWHRAGFRLFWRWKSRRGLGRPAVPTEIRQLIREIFVRRVRSLGIRDHPTSARSPWQNGYAERLIGLIRRECLDHIVVIGEQHLHHILRCYMEYYNAVRTHLSLGKDAPVRRLIQRTGRIQVRPVLGGLHHQYVRI